MSLLAVCFVVWPFFYMSLSNYSFNIFWYLESAFYFGRLTPVILTSVPHPGLWVNCVTLGGCYFSPESAGWAQTGSRAWFNKFCFQGLLTAPDLYFGFLFFSVCRKLSSVKW